MLFVCVHCHVSLCGQQHPECQQLVSCIHLSFVNFALHPTPQTEVYVSIFKQLYLDNHSELDTCRYEHFFSQWRIISHRKILTFLLNHPVYTPNHPIYTRNHPYIILVNNKLDAQFFMYVYFYSLHVSGSHVPIIRITIVSLRHLVYVTLCK